MTRDDRIRLIFRNRRRFTRRSAATALGKSIQWVDEHRFARENGGFVVWEEMVLLAFLLWTRVQIHRALGDHGALIFPRLARLVTLTVRLPAHKVLALRDEARRRGVDVSALIADGVSVFREVAERLEEHVPGYMEAWHFPYTRSTATAAKARVVRRTRQIPRLTSRDHRGFAARRYGGSVRARRS